LFGAHEEADARLIKCALHPHCSTVEAEILGTRLTYKIAAPGRHLVGKSLTVLAATELAGADLAHSPQRRSTGAIERNSSSVNSVSSSFIRVARWRALGAS
jgi:UDP-N-acetylmuramyl pentapeptide synthase